MKIVFIGSSIFGLKCLKTCLKISEVEVTGIVTAPQKFNISYRPQGVKNVLHADFSEIANANNIPCAILTRSMNDTSFLRTIASWKPDIFLVVGWYHIIPKLWRDIAPAYGLHASLLPDYSGGSPLVWAMINGEKKTGITFFKMDDGVDSGPIVDQREEKILFRDTIMSLYARIEKKGLEILREKLPIIKSGDLNLKIQNESKRRLMPQRSPEDGCINWSQDAEAIIRFIRAQTKPYPGAFTYLAEKELYIWTASLANSKKKFTVPGKVHKIEEDVYLVSCKKGAIELREISFETQTYVNDEIKFFLKDGNQQFK